MAEAILFGIAEEILLKLGEQAVNQISQIWRVKAELLKLSKTLSTIRAVLLDAEEKKANSQFGEAVKNWLERLEDAVYDADNVVDEFRYAQLRRRLVFGNKRAKKVRIFFSKLNQFVFRTKLARKFKNIRETLDQINRDRSEFRLEERLVDKHHFTRLETDSFIIKDEVIGRDKDREELLQFLLNNPESEENVSFIPVVGIGGLGKTTLAKLLFNHDEVKNHFELKAWVCVSLDFDVKALVSKIIKSITRESLAQNLDMDQLQSKLLGQIDRKRYLLVLDDIWNEDEEKWDSLKGYLMCGARGSKVLITTRSLRVAGITQTVEPHILKGLDEDMSSLLFKTVAFEKGKEIEDSSDLAKIGREILDKCRGVPLAIKTIGRLLHLKQLRSRNPANEWMLFKNSKLATIDGPSETDILPTLKLSYDNLPSRLKHCFAFCSLFPEDYRIDVEELIRLWIAQGFVEPSKNTLVSLEEVGYEYFVDLLWRSFFQEVEKNKQGAIISCKMHDLMHDLSISVAGKGVILMLDQISKDNTQRMGNSGSDIISTKNVRHAYVDFGDNASYQIPSSLFEPKKLRTLLISSEDIFNANFDAVLKFKFLRSLRLSIRSLEILPYKLGELIHLRYLDLSSTSIKVLPDSITRLHHLETLNLAKCYELERLSQDTKKLVNLRHLELRECDELTHMPHGIGELTSLRTLTKFVVADDNNELLSRQSARLGELSGLKNLHGKLEIELRHIKNVVALELKTAPLKDIEHLHTLCLSWDKDEVNSKENHEMVLDGLQPCQTLKALRLHYYMGLRLSNWLSSLTNLVTLKLKSCENLQHIPHLHCLSSLEKLEIWACHAMEYISEMDEDEFCASIMSFLPSLKQLKIWDCGSLKGWWRSMKSGDSALTPVPLQETIISSASSSSTPSKLSNLEVDKMIGRGDFSSLRSIIITLCPNWAFLPKIIFNLPSLQKVNCRQRNEFGSPDEIEAYVLTQQTNFQ